MYDSTCAAARGLQAEGERAAPSEKDKAAGRQSKSLTRKSFPKQAWATRWELLAGEELGMLGEAQTASGCGAALLYLLPQASAAYVGAANMGHLGAAATSKNPKPLGEPPWEDRGSAHM